MNWTVIGAIGEIIGAIAVVVSLLYLAMQVRGSNALQAAQTRYNLRVQRSAPAMGLDAYTLEALYKYVDGADVTRSEKGAVLLFALAVLEMWEWQYGEHQAGMLERDKLPVASWRIWFHGDGEIPVPVREVWEKRKHVLIPDFVKFMEQNVVND